MTSTAAGGRLWKVALVGLVAATAIVALVTYAASRPQRPGLLNLPPTTYPDGDLGPTGCIVNYGPRLPAEPGKPDFPCAVSCEGPNAGRVYATEGFSDALDQACLQMGPNKPEGQAGLLPFDGPGGGIGGVAPCKMRTGGRRMLTFWRKWYPKGHPRCAKVSGEPHARTLDGTRYGLHAVGELVAVRSLDDDLEVQIRLRAVTPRVATTSAVAARVGSRRVTFTVGDTVPVRLDGEPLDLPAGHAWHLTDRDALLVHSRDDRYTIVWPDESNLHVEFHGSFLNAYFLPPPARWGRFVGVFGDGDGDPANDFRTRDGTALDAPPEFAERYGSFVESWRVRPEESLFDYGPGESTETFTDRSVPSERAETRDLAPEDRARAEAACRDAGVTEPAPFEECVVDLGFTKDTSFIASALAQQVPGPLRGRPVEADYSTAQGDSLRFPLGELSFADFVAEHEPGGPGPAPDRPEADPRNALGSPDHEPGRNYVSLGVGGSLTLAFTDNVLVDVPGPDLVVFEVGPAMERFSVAISEDGKTFVEVDTVSRKGATIDIGPVARPGARYTHVRITQPDPRRSDRHRSNAGPDIDAVGALGAELP